MNLDLLADFGSPSNRDSGRDSRESQDSHGGETVFSSEGLSDIKEEQGEGEEVALENEEARDTGRDETVFSDVEEDILPGRATDLVARTATEENDSDKASSEGESPETRTSVKRQRDSRRESSTKSQASSVDSPPKKKSRKPSHC